MNKIYVRINGFRFDLSTKQGQEIVLKSITKGGK